jgi:dolichol-phosphate mannosyltransferase
MVGDPELATDIAPTPVYSFVIPVLNEVDTLDALYDRLVSTMASMDGACEVVLVDDGSTDGSFEAMRALHERDPRVRVVRLSRNFGHQVALTAGLDHARGEAAILLDADLQDPPEVAVDLAAKWREGYAVVYAVRDSRAGESWAKRSTARWFYRLLDRVSDVHIPLDSGDFRLVDRKAIDAVREMPEQRRYLRGMFAWVGYDQAPVHYERAPRHAGRTKFSTRKMLRFAADGVLSFSTVPLRLTLAIGFLLSIASISYAIFAITLRVVDAYTVPGWVSIVAGITFLGGLQLLMLGVIGQYVALIHDEVKRRPLYLVRDQLDSPTLPTGTDDRSARVTPQPESAQRSVSSSPSTANTTSSGSRSTTEVAGSSSSQPTSGATSSMSGSSTSSVSGATNP